MATSFIPILLELPAPVEASLEIAHSRMSAPADDASRWPLSFPTESEMRLTVTFDDGTSRDFTTDGAVDPSRPSRVAFRVPRPECAAVDAALGTVSVLPGARAADCAAVEVEGTVRLSGVTLDAIGWSTLVFLLRLQLDFVGHPRQMNPAPVSALFPIECLLSTHTRAEAQVSAFLTDAPTSALSVTAASTISSSNASVVWAMGTLRVGGGGGEALISARFGESSATAPLRVSSSLASLWRIDWALQGAVSDSISLTRQGTQQTVVSVSYRTTEGGGATYEDVGSAAFAGWLDLSSLVKFSSDSLAVEVSRGGTLTLLDNSLATISLRAFSLCTTSGPSSDHVVSANLLPLQMDVDLGEEQGVQFIQQQGEPLAVRVTVRPLEGFYMTSFMLRIDLEPAVLSSAYADGASWVDAQAFSGIVEQFGDPQSEVRSPITPAAILSSGLLSAALLPCHAWTPGGHTPRLVFWQVVLSAANPSSTQQTSVTVGTIMLGVVNSGVTLVDGTILSLLMSSMDNYAVHQEVQDQPIVAGRGFASVTTGARRNRLLGATLQSQVRPPLPPVRRLAELECDPCVSRVWGDFNGDCKFLSSDVDYLAQLILRRMAFSSGASKVDPLEQPGDWTVNDVSACPDFIKLQANPSRDLIPTRDSSDARHLRPAITAMDTQHLLYGTVKKHRLLAEMAVTCEVGSSGRETGEL